MTPLEKESLDTLRVVVDQFAPGRANNRVEYMQVMAKVRDTISALENYSFGCATGLHRGSCTCRPPVRGECIR